jgi:hypothetical protein
MGMVSLIAEPTLTVAEAVAVQPFAVPVTVYVVVEAGATLMLAVVRLLLHK